MKHWLKLMQYRLEAWLFADQFAMGYLWAHTNMVKFKATKDMMVDYISFEEQLFNNNSKKFVEGAWYRAGE